MKVFVGEVGEQSRIKNDMETKLAPIPGPEDTPLVWEVQAWRGLLNHSQTWPPRGLHSAEAESRVTGRRGDVGSTPRTESHHSVSPSQSPLCPGLSSTGALAARKDGPRGGPGRLGECRRELRGTGFWIHLGDSHVCLGQAPVSKP